LFWFIVDGVDCRRNEHEEEDGSGESAGEENRISVDPISLPGVALLAKGGTSGAGIEFGGYFFVF
jgi:hypothetical protein